ncbi:MAG: AraC family transcriptional regulator [Rhizobiales bacterium]|nr:AraC family transcriptional regulator [Hyphomicrobiales bacterium]MBA69377.1 AraC family transcriptional regulator [Hyphomicrobiales bacterium]|tara:strand:- start:306 stop:1256 length:951 start_codon:yes stop_codon:yes gene_type:complete
MTGMQHFMFALAENFTHLAFSCAVEPLRLANLISNKDLYRWSFASPDGRTATSSNGAVTLVHHSFENLPECDRLFVISGIEMHRRDHSDLIATLRRERSRGRQIGALCSGAWVLAKAGFLYGMQAAIHWEYHDAFMEEFPDVNLVRNVFVADEKFITASGGTATADLMLHLIEVDHGYDLSAAIADQMVYAAVRNSTAAQRASLHSRHGMRSKHIVKAIEMMRDNIDDPISPAAIARELGISPRQIQRLFGRHLNTSPTKYFMEMRLERAHHLLKQTDSSVTQVAVACGFVNPGHFSRIYRAAYGVSPMTDRSRLS